MAFDEQLASRVRALLGDRGFVTIAPAGLGDRALGRLVAAAVAHSESLPPKPRAARRMNR